MTFDKDNYKIELTTDDIFSEDSVNNLNSYHKVYLGKSGYITTQIAIRIYENDKVVNSGLIGSEGGGSGIHQTSQILENERLVVCCSDSVFCLSIPELNLIWKTQADLFTCFEIFKYQDSYIIHGELEISRLDHNGEIVWQQGGADIFTTLEGTNDFEITASYIRATDWNNKIYKFDFDGTEIN